ncbi:MAG: carboxypeptidase-like regulatory domain-containing protein [Saprospiraceae bacterium]
MNTRHVNTRFFLLLLLACCFSTSSLVAQGFIRKYPFFTWSQGGGQSLFPQADGSFRMTALAYPDFGVDVQLQWLHTDDQGFLVQGDSLYTPNSGSPVYGNDIFLLENGGYLRAYIDTNRLLLHRYDVGGTILWESVQALPDSGWNALVSVVANAAEETFVRCYNFGGNATVADDGMLFKFAADGTLLWDAVYPFTLTYVIPSRLQPTADGGCLFNNWGTVDTNTLADEVLFRFDGNGTMAWYYSPYPARLWPHFDGQIFDLNSQGQTYLFAQEVDNSTNTNPLRLDKLSPTGQLLDSVYLNTLLNNDKYLEGELVIATADGGAVVVVQERLLNAWYYVTARIQPDGSLAWQRPLGFLSDALPTEFYQGRELPDGSLVLYAYQGTELYLIKLGADGKIYPHSLTGQIARDSTFNCVLDAFDPPLEGWAVQATGNGLTQYASSNAAGRYVFSDLDNGNYEIVLTPPSYLWEPCFDTVQLTFTSPAPIADTLDFPVQSLYDCPLMEVDIATPFLRRCFGNTFAVHYCNVGNETADPASVTVLLDPLLTVDSASIPYTQDGQLLTFDLGVVAAGACGSFKLFTALSCDAELGQTLCVEAHIFPDTICAMNLPNWSGAQVEVSAECAGDSVIFLIHNTGTATMPNALDFIIVDDHVITRQGMFQLPPGGIHPETVPADGSTWRLIADQEPGFPFGPQRPSVGMEACLSNPQGNPSWGMLNMFTNYTGNPFHDTDCRTVIGAWDPNDKQALPIGVDAPHFIEQNQPLEYLIRFQNTGTDTAFTVVIRDTLSPWLNPASIRPGASSHPYRWALSGAGILTFTFENIMLPDSNVNEAASHGFVQFRIDQQRDNPLGAVIENRAGIYFDFNEPVITNTVFHTVGENFLPTATRELSVAPLQLRIWPNPATHQTTVKLDELYRPGRLLMLRAASGRLIHTWPAQYLRQECPRAGVPAGLYWLELRDEGRLIAAGKLIWMD